MVSCYGGYTYAAKVWDSPIVQGPLSVAPRQTVEVTIATFASLFGSSPSPCLYPRPTAHLSASLVGCGAQAAQQDNDAKGQGVGSLPVPKGAPAEVARVLRAQDYYEVYSDEKVANRDIRVWHGATETGP
jgi:hypothetical protein